jgi:hypothetical protein
VGFVSFADLLAEPEKPAHVWLSELALTVNFWLAIHGFNVSIFGPTPPTYSEDRAAPSGRIVGCRWDSGAKDPLFFFFLFLPKDMFSIGSAYDQQRHGTPARVAK